MYVGLYKTEARIKESGFTGAQSRRRKREG